MAVSEKGALEQQYVASVVLRQMDKNHLEAPVRGELISTLRTICPAILALPRINKAQYLNAVDGVDFEDYPLYGDI